MAHNRSVSEAINETGYTRNQPTPNARLRFKPDTELSGYLQQFVRPELRIAMARKGLFLYSDQSILSTNVSHTAHTNAASPAHSAIERELRQRGSSHLMLARRMQFQPSTADNPNMKQRLEVILSQLTAGVVIEHMKVHPDYSVGAHVSLARTALVSRDAFMAASRELYERLLDEKPNPGVDDTELIVPLT